MKDLLKNKFFIGILVVALFFLGFMLNSATSDGMSPPENIAGIIITPFQNAFSRLFGTSGNLVKSLTEYNAEVKKNEQLNRKVAELEDKLNDFERYKTENDQLKSVLGIKDVNPDFKFQMADVIGKETGGWFMSYIIDKGTSSGLKNGDPVITPDGLVGKISKTGTTWSRVTTILDRDCAAGSIVARTGDVAVVEGDYELGKSGFCKLSFVENTVNLNRGDIIETSGLQGTFPKGLRVGRIEEVRPDSSGISQSAVIRPAVDFTKLRQVYIIIEFSKD